MNNAGGVMVWVGDYGNFAVPPEVIAKAEAANAGKSLDDRRTKGSKIIAHWGKTEDLTARTAMWLDEASRKQ